MQTLAQISKEQTAFIEKYLGVKVPSANAPEPWDKLHHDIGNVLSTWRGVEASAAPGFDRLKDGIREAYEPYPEMASEVASSLAKLDPLLGVFSPQIGTALTELLDLDDAAERVALARTTLTRIDKSLKILTSHPIAKVVDESGFTQSVSVVGPAIKALGDLRSLLVKLA